MAWSKPGFLFPTHNILWTQRLQPLWSKSYILLPIFLENIAAQYSWLGKSAHSCGFAMSKIRAIYISSWFASSGRSCRLPLTKPDGWAAPGWRQQLFGEWDLRNGGVEKLDKGPWRWAVEGVFPGLCCDLQAGECLDLRLLYINTKLAGKLSCWKLPEGGYI